MDNQGVGYILAWLNGEGPTDSCIAVLVALCKGKDEKCRLPMCRSLSCIS